MEFKFNINEIFKEPIVEINQNLIPPGFKGDRRALWDTVMKVSEVINAMGEASAVAQGLTKTITSAERLRSSENQKLYFLVDQNANGGKGAVTGMLKVGRKGLYLFDNDGRYYQVSPPCILDFYVHESRQRNGLGKQLFEHMLQKEQVPPLKMALDRPSEKFLNFLNKYYCLNKPIKQMNNYVVFDGFFPENQEEHEEDGRRSATLDKSFSANGLQSSPAYGRYGPPRPPSCSMGQIIHNQTSAINSNSPVGDSRLQEQRSVSKSERPRSLTLQHSEPDDDGISRDWGATHEENQMAYLEDSIENIKLTDDTKRVNIDTENIRHIKADDDDVDTASEAKAPSHLTEQGYFDLKFYHNKLW